jgi:nucleotide-binding universal stress UspA family protein
MKDSAPSPRPDTGLSETSAQPADRAMERWIHPAVILVATDLNDLDRLMPFALEQAAQTSARLLLLHVLPRNAALAADASGMPYYDPTGAFNFAAHALEPHCALAHERDIACEALVREGNPAQQIGAVARQFQADRLLLGTRSRSKLGELLLGSVAEQVLRSVNLPVITVGPEAHLPVDAGPRERVVLHATTLRETSRPSAALAFRIAASQGAKLLLLHVLPPQDPPFQDPPFLNQAPQGYYFAAQSLINQSAAQEQCRSGQPASPDSAAMIALNQFAAETGASFKAVVESHVVHGNPFIEILAAASERHASLIVLGARHRSVFAELTRDHTIYRVLAHARCPVLTLRVFESRLGAKQTPQFATYSW